MIDKPPSRAQPTPADPHLASRPRLPGIRAAMRLSWRFVAIVAIVSGYGLRFPVLWASRRMFSDSADRVFGENVCRCCEALGPTFIKLGQILSARPDLIAPALARTLGRLQTRVRPLRSGRVLPLLREAYSRPVADLFAEFDLEPIGSGSIAQVHRARLRGGGEVAVKIRRPGIQAKIDADLALLALFAQLATRLPALRFMPMVEVVAEISDLIRQQLDFSREAESNRKFRQSFHNVELVRFPAVVDALCTPTVLVMEFMPDLAIVTASGLATDLKRAAALRGVRALYQMIFLDGFIHADMHPGNIFVRQWGEVVILDTGLVAQLSDRARLNFVEFFFALVNGKGMRCAEIICESALFIAPDCDLRGFQDSIVELIESYAGLRSRDFEITRFVAALMETQRRFGICGSVEFVTTIIALVVFDGICKQLYPECDFQAEARPFLIAAKYRRASPPPRTGFMSA